MSDYKEFTDRMEKTCSVLTEQFNAVRAGRANAAVLDQITVEYYGSASPIQQLATISTPDARTLTIQPWDASVLKSIEKAIQVSDLGINPQNDGRVIRLVFPQLTEERRKDLVKVVRGEIEQTRVEIRNIRRDANNALKALEKAKDISEDEQHDGEEQIQKLTDASVKKCDELLAAKEKELMEI